MQMANNEKCCSTQLIDGDGAFNVAGIENFMKEVKLSECGLSYAVVSIMGPQSSGMLRDLNFVSYSFPEQICCVIASTSQFALEDVSQTTRGIWMARCVGIEPCTLVMDLEGTDGRERGEDDTTFEKQSALFALAISDIVLINMWCHDIGREQAANKPLLKTVFQVMMRLFSPRKTTMLFVIRDKTKTPLENLEPVLREDIQKIWDSVPKPDAHKETPLSEFFIVEVVALSSFEEKEEQFKEQVANLRQRFYHSIAPGGLAGDRRGVVPASGFSFSAQEIWKIIKENKDLDLPAHKVMVATVRCEEIANEKYDLFATNKDWCELEEAVQSGPISGFGKKLNSLITTCLSEYDAEANYFDEGVRSAKQKQLQEKLFQLVQPTFQIALGHIRSGILDKFKEAFDKALNGGEGFSSAANKCIEFYMAQFDEGCADTIETFLSHVIGYPKLLDITLYQFDTIVSKEVPPSKTLITPVQCKSLWRQFKMETEYSVSQAISAQEANNRSRHWLPPPWAIVALLILGFNEFMTLLRNPLYLGVIFVGYLLIKALWAQLDITGEFRHGALPGIISLSSKFVPTIMNLIRKLAEEGHGRHAAKVPAGRVTSSSASSSVTSSGNGAEYTSSSKYE
ncbi:hypothetical protein JHK87_038121 [Glycine soja]|nr:hypothetical protein JHK87_038121 [Glycine soja]